MKNGRGTTSLSLPKIHFTPLHSLFVGPSNNQPTDCFCFWFGCFLQVLGFGWCATTTTTTRDEEGGHFSYNPTIRSNVWMANEIAQNFQPRIMGMLIHIIFRCNGRDLGQPETGYFGKIVMFDVISDIERHTIEDPIITVRFLTIGIGVQIVMFRHEMSCDRMQTHPQNRRNKIEQQCLERGVPPQQQIKRQYHNDIESFLPGRFFR